MKIKDTIGKLFGSKKISDIEKEKQAGIDASSLGWDEIGSSKNTSPNVLWFAVGLEKNAENIASVKIVLRDRSDMTKEVVDHEFIRKLSKPNSMMGGKTFIHLLYMQYIIYGNAYIYTKPDGDWVLVDPRRVSVVYEDPNEKLYPKSYTVNGTPVSIDSIYHYRTPDGIPFLNKVQPFLDINEALVTFTKAFYDNGGFIGDVIKTEAVNESQIFSIRNGYDASHKGSGTANKTLFLPKGADIVFRQGGGGNKQATEERRSNRDEILATLGVPKHILGITETGASRADSDAKQFAYFLNTIQPAAQNIYDFFTNSVLQKMYPGSEDLYISIVSQIEGDRDQSREDAVALLGSKNTKAFGTINEARVLMNLPPIEGGDIIPSSNVITPNDPENPEDGEISETEPIPVNGESGIFDSPVKYKNLKIKHVDPVEKEFDSLTRNIVSSLAKKKEQLKKGCEHEEFKQEEFKQEEFKQEVFIKQEVFTDEEIELIAEQTERREGILAEEEDKIEEGMRKLFRSQRSYAVQLFNLRFTSNFDVIKQIENDPYIDEEDAYRRMLSIFAPVIKESVEKVGIIEFELLKPVKLNPLEEPYFKVTEEMDAAILEYSQISSRSITHTTNTTIQNIVKRGLQEGKGLEVIRREISRAFDQFENWRARRTAKTATFFASNMAGYESMRQSARVKTTKWYNPSPCQYCANYNGRVVEIGKKYAIKGETILGTEGGQITVWRDTLFPPIHPNCQCVLLAEEFYE